MYTHTLYTHTPLKTVPSLFPVLTDLESEPRRDHLSTPSSAHTHTHCNLSFHKSVTIDFPLSISNAAPRSGASCYQLFVLHSNLSAGRAARKRPLAARPDDDSFTAPDWHTTFNHSILPRKSRAHQTRLVSDHAANEPHKQTDEHNSSCVLCALMCCEGSVILDGVYFNDTHTVKLSQQLHLQYFLLIFNNLCPDNICDNNYDVYVGFRSLMQNTER